MLRTSDFLLTFAAICLLIAALDGKSRVIRASAQEVQLSRGDGGQDSRHLSFIMDKIKRNLLDRKNPDFSPKVSFQMKSNQLKRTQIFTDPRLEHNSNSYTFFANETVHHEDQKLKHQPEINTNYNQPQEVKIKFLRSKLPEFERIAQNSTNNMSLYLLSSSHLNAANQLRDPVNKPLVSSSVDSNDIDVGEQQQQPPFTMFPQSNQALNQNGQSIPMNNIREILNNYQRAYNGNSDQNGRQAQHLAGQLPALNQLTQQQQLQLANLLRPPQANNLQQPSQPRREPNALSTPTPSLPVTSGPQQPFSPLQLLTGPLQALLPGLGGAQQPNQAPQTGNSKARPRPTSTGLSEQAQQPAQPANPFNPFGIPALNPNGVQQQQQQQHPGIANLQALYQQMPLYQALLAARQRQEALEAAQKMRQQQVQKSTLPTASRSPFGQLPGGFTPQAQPSPPPTQAPSASDNGWGTPKQQAGGGQQHALSAVGHNQPAAVQFDDEPNNGNEIETNGHKQSPPRQPEPQVQPHDKPESQDNAGGPNNNQSNQSDDQSEQNGTSGEDNNQANDAGAQEPSKESNQEEEDPDLKQFQNLANGGDSFTDLFPPGILSNNDINEIKKQQDEQAKKQEEEERLKQIRQQQQQQQHQPQQDHQPIGAQQQFDQPINQFAGNSNNYPGDQQNNDKAQTNNGHSDESEPADGVAGDSDEQPDQPQDDSQEEGENQQDNNEPDETNDQETDSNPTAAALTSKWTTEEPQKIKADNSKRFLESPGVQYIK